MNWSTSSPKAYIAVETTSRSSSSSSSSSSG